MRYIESSLNPSTENRAFVSVADVFDITIVGEDAPVRGSGISPACMAVVFAPVEKAILDIDYLTLEKI